MSDLGKVATPSKSVASTCVLMVPMALIRRAPHRQAVAGEFIDEDHHAEMGLGPNEAKFPDMARMFQSGPDARTVGQPQIEIALAVSVALSQARIFSSSPSIRVWICLSSERLAISLFSARACWTFGQSYSVRHG